MKNINKTFFKANESNYTRNCPKIQKTSNLSVHFKDFICVSAEPQHISLKPKL